MKVLQCSLASLVKKINIKYFLPAIQRSFVWDEDRIVELFDSLYKDYPIGNSIFWKIDNWNNKLCPLYQFESSHKESEKKIASQKQGLTQGSYQIVLDGQQRLTSLFIGYKGSFSTKKPGKGRKSFIKKYLYFDLLENGSSEGYSQFSFMTKEEAVEDQKHHLWFRVEDAYTAKKFDEYKQQVKIIKKSIGSKLWQNKSKTITERLKNLYKMTYDETRFSYYEINRPFSEVECVSDIFTRINTSGITLKKADLLFSNLITWWGEDGQKEIKTAMENIQERTSDISQDFIMRSCLYLSDLTVKYNLNNFNRPNIEKIMTNWPQIKKAIERMLENLDNIGYVDSVKGLSETALIPFLYFIKLKGRNPTSEELKQFKKYYVASQICGSFGGNSDSVLKNMRDEIKRQYQEIGTFSYKELRTKKSKVYTLYHINKEKLEEIVENTQYGTARAYYALMLMYPSGTGGKEIKYQMDHVHPKALFTRQNLKDHNCEDNYEDWLEKRNSLPNLQLLASLNNKEKSKKPINDYINSIKKKEARSNFIKENFLPKDQLDITFFEEFFQYRKNKIVDKLCEVLE